MESEKLDKAYEAVKNAKIILEDMKKNRSHYNAKDLSWRNIDLNKVMIETMGLVIEAIMDQNESASTLNELRIEKGEEPIDMEDAFVARALDKKMEKAGIEKVESTDDELLGEDFEEVFDDEEVTHETETSLTKEVQKNAKNEVNIRPSSPEMVDGDKTQE